EALRSIWRRAVASSASAKCARQLGLVYISATSVTSHSPSASELSLKQATSRCAIGSRRFSYDFIKKGHFKQSIADAWRHSQNRLVHEPPHSRGHASYWCRANGRRRENCRNRRNS